MFFGWKNVKTKNDKYILIEPNFKLVWAGWAQNFNEFIINDFKYQKHK